MNLRYRFIGPNRPASTALDSVHFKKQREPYVLPIMDELSLDSLEITADATYVLRASLTQLS